MTCTALVDAATKFPEQWDRLLIGWGEVVPSRVMKNGKTVTELRQWATNCRQKVANSLGKIPDDAEKNDGFWEVRATWMQERAIHLESEADRLESDIGEDQKNGTRSLKKSAILPMPSREKLPFQARPAFVTKRQREEQTVESIGFGEALLIEGPAHLPSPTASTRRPFKQPRTSRPLKKEEDAETEASDSEGTEGSPIILL